jgi:8-oxo-dGTP pyrophosphatase MutT (NUDIX family)
MSARTIHLRRPATLSIQEGVFVPKGDSGILAEVDRRWDALCAANPKYSDGRLYHVLGVHRNGHGGCVLHVIDCAYRFLAVQNDGFDLGVRALGVKGVVERDGQYLVGLRAPHVMAYQNLWEFAPAGGVEPGQTPAQIILDELREETGLSARSDPVGIAVLFDPVLKSWELVYRLAISEQAPQHRSDEYSRLEWRSHDDVPDQLSPIAQQIRDLLKQPSSSK